VGGLSGDKVSMVQDYGMRRNTAPGPITEGVPKERWIWRTFPPNSTHCLNQG
jgi:hypothetical protein